MDHNLEYIEDFIKEEPLNIKKEDYYEDAIENNSNLEMESNAFYNFGEEINFCKIKTKSNEEENDSQNLEGNKSTTLGSNNSTNTPSTNELKQALSPAFTVEMRKRKEQIYFNKAKNKRNVFACLECDYTTNHKSNLKVHMFSHSDETPFKCSKCDYSSKYPQNLKAHVRRRKCKMKKIKTQDNNKEKEYLCSEGSYGIGIDLTQLSKEKIYKCIYCGDSFPNSEILRAHEKTSKCTLKIDKEANNLAPLKRPYEETTKEEVSPAEEKPVLQKEFKSVNTIMKRELIDIKRFRCKDCNYSTTNHLLFQQHKNSHSDERPYKCKNCNSTYKYKPNLYRHWKNSCKQAKRKNCVTDGARSEKAKKLLQNNTNLPNGNFVKYNRNLRKKNSVSFGGNINRCHKEKLKGGVSNEVYTNTLTDKRDSEQTNTDLNSTHKTTNNKSLKVKPNDQKSKSLVAKNHSNEVARKANPSTTDKILLNPLSSTLKAKCLSSNSDCDIDAYENSLSVTFTEESNQTPALRSTKRQKTLKHKKSSTEMYSDSDGSEVYSYSDESKMYSDFDESEIDSNSDSDMSDYMLDDQLSLSSKRGLSKRIKKKSPTLNKNSKKNVASSSGVSDQSESDDSHFINTKTFEQNVSKSAEQNVKTNCFSSDSVEAVDLSRPTEENDNDLFKYFPADSENTYEDEALIQLFFEKPEIRLKKLKLVYCTKCEFVSQSYSKLRTHKFETHFKSKIYYCSKCDFFEVTRRALQLHEDTHHENADKEVLPEIYKIGLEHSGRNSCNKKDEVLVMEKVKEASGGSFGIETDKSNRNIENGKLTYIDKNILGMINDKVTSVVGDIANLEFKKQRMVISSSDPFVETSQSERKIDGTETVDKTSYDYLCKAVKLYKKTLSDTDPHQSNSYETLKGTGTEKKDLLRSKGNSEAPKEIVNELRAPVIKTSSSFQDASYPLYEKFKIAPMPQSARKPQKLLSDLQGPRITSYSCDNLKSNKINRPEIPIQSSNISHPNEPEFIALGSDSKAVVVPGNASVKITSSPTILYSSRELPGAQNSTTSTSGILDVTSNFYRKLPERLTNKYPILSNILLQDSPSYVGNVNPLQKDEVLNDISQLQNQSVTLIIPKEGYSAQEIIFVQQQGTVSETNTFKKPEHNTSKTTSKDEFSQECCSSNLIPKQDISCYESTSAAITIEKSKTSSVKCKKKNSNVKGTAISCYLCEFITFSKVGLYRHMYTYHQILSYKTVSCDQCEFMTLSKKSLTDHRYRKHQKKKI